MQERNERNIFTYFSQYNRDLIECVYASATSSNMKKIFLKKWGNYLSGNIFSKLTEEETKEFEKCAATFERYLEVSLKLQKKGYSLPKIKAYFLEQKAIQNVSTKRKNTVVIYKDVRVYQQKYDMTEEEMLDILDELSTPKRICFTYIYGVNRPKKTLQETCEILDCSKNLAVAYLKAVEEEFQKFQLNKLKQQNISTVPSTKTFKSSLFDYYDEKDKQYVLQALEWYHDNDVTYYNVVLKAYGKHYSYLNKSMKFKKAEIELLSRFIESVLPNTIKKIKSGFPIKDKKGKKRKNSIYDYGKPEDRELIQTRIDWWKEHNSKFYNVIVKLYGETYDALDSNIDLNEAETKTFTSMLTGLNNYIKKSKEDNLNKKPKSSSRGQRRKQSIYDYFAEEDKEYVLERIEWWKENNPDYYNLIVKVYGETYDHLNEQIQLSLEESKTMSNILTRLKNYINKRKNGQEIINRGRRKQVVPKQEKKKDIVFNKTISSTTENESVLIVPEMIQGTPKETMILLFKSNHFNMTDEAICSYLDITMEELDSCYCKNLHLFGSMIPSMIEKLITRNKENVSRILKLSYLNSFLQTLTLKEKIYLQLKLESYANPSLTDEKIAQLTGVAQKDLKKYEIMTPYEELNQLNVLLKK